MIIYNVTMQVDWSVHEDWLKWLKETHVPEVIATGMFTHHRIVHLLEVEEADGPTYAVQFFTQSLGNYYYYINHHAEAFQQQTSAVWGDKFVSFSTVMETVDEE